MLVLIASVLVVSCGGLKEDPTTLQVNDETIRILGANFPNPLPSIIAFTRDIPDDENIYGMNREIFVTGPNGNMEARLTWNPADDNYPALAPNGRALAFVSNRSTGGYGSHDIFRLGPGNSIQQLTNDSWEWDAHATDWGPGFITAARINTLIGAPFDVGHVIKLDPWGNWQTYINTGHIVSYAPAVGRSPNILVFSARPAGATYCDDLELYLLTDYQDEAIRLTFFGENSDDPSELIYTTNAQFDRQARRVIFQTTYWGDNEIALINLTDSASDFEPVRLTVDVGEDVEPCFDPSGQWFCWASNRNGNFELYKQLVYDPNSPSPIPPVIQLTNTELDEHNPDWGSVLKIRKNTPF